MLRSIDDTAAGLGDDGAAWRRLFGRPSASFDVLGDDIFRPILHVRRATRSAWLRFGLPAARPRHGPRPQLEHPPGARPVRRRRRPRIQPPHPPA